jgi:hypothetical protein
LELVSDDLTFHRTFGEFPERYLVYYEALTSAFQEAGAFTAWHIRGNNLAPVVAYRWHGQDFRKAATEWELANSKFFVTHGGADPVLDDKHEVVGHFGSFSGDRIIVPKGYFQRGLNEMVQRGVPAFVVADGNMVGVADLVGTIMAAVSAAGTGTKAVLDFDRFESYDIGVISHQLLTDVEGTVLADLGTTSHDALEDSPVQLYDLIMLPKLAVDLGIAVAGFIRTLVPKAIKGLSKGLRAALRELAKDGRKVADEVLRTQRKKIIPIKGEVNVGGGNETPDITDLNPIKQGSGGPQRGIPNHVHGSMEEMDQIFVQGSVKKVISVRLRVIDVDWPKATKAAANVMPRGGKVMMNIWTWTPEQQAAIKAAFEAAGFSNVEVAGLGPGTMLTAIR